MIFGERLHGPAILGDGSLNFSLLEWGHPEIAKDLACSGCTLATIVGCARDPSGLKSFRMTPV
jgi:hypothetical protein